MKLIWSSASPFARKALFLAHELGLGDKIETVVGTGTPMAPNASVTASNPLSKLPTLITDAGVSIFDSAVICQYLIAKAPGQSMLADTGDARWASLTLEAMADGMCDAAILMRYEVALRPEAQQSPEWLAAQEVKIDGALDALEGHWAAHLSGPADLGQVAICCALGYLDLRFPDKDWRAGRPGLAAWYTRFSTRAAAIATNPSA